MLHFRRYACATRRVSKRLMAFIVLGLVHGSTLLNGHADQTRNAPSVRFPDAASPLLANPMITYSTYLGGNGYPLSPDKDVGNDIAVDAAGNIYVVGSTNSLGRYDSDVFVRKFDSSGSTLLYETFLDSDGSDDVGLGIAVDAAGYAYVTGRLGDWWFQQGRGALVAKLSPTGVPLYQVTLGADSDGGFSGDFGVRIAVDDVGNAYVAGTTYQPFWQPFPTTPGAFQESYGGGDHDAFVAKVDPQGRVVHATLLGGSGDDQAWGIAIRKVGNVYHAYVTGETNSAEDFPITAGVFQPTFNDVRDAFVTQLNASGSALIYSTYLGGNGIDESFAIAVDSAGSAYLTGLTAEYPLSSNNFPIVNAFQSTYGGAGSNPALANAFVAKLNPAGTALVYSSYLGGAGSNLSDIGHAIKVDGAGYAYLVGSTETRPDIYSGLGFPIVNAFQPEHGGGVSDAFVTKLNPQGALVYSSYLGGNGEESGNGIALGASGKVYMTGLTSSEDFPITPGSFQEVLFGSDAFVTKIGDPAAPSTVLTVSKTGSGDGTVASTPTGIHCGSDCAESYTNGAVVMLTAEPTVGSIFAGWSGDPDCHDGLVTMNANKTCTATFTIVSSAPITVTTPNGGEICVRGKSCLITWTAALSGKVKIEVSYDGGQSWVTVLKSTVNDGRHRWRTKGVPTTQARIRVSSSTVPSLFDVSDGHFVIR